MDNSVNLITIGVGRDDIPLGIRSSGLIVGKTTETSRKLQIVPSAAMAFAPVLWSEAIRLGFRTAP
jgi:hypothetical protein